MKKALETRPVLAPGQCISDAVLQIAKKPFGMPRRKEDYSNIIHTSLSTKQMPQDATCRDSCGAFAGIAGLSNMQTLKKSANKIWKQGMGENAWSGSLIILILVKAKSVKKGQLEVLTYHMKQKS